MSTGIVRAAAGFVALLVMGTIGVSGLLAQDDENGWPRELDADFGQVIMYQPQVESYAGNKLEARAALSVTPKGETTPVFGAMWFEARMETDTDTRMVSLESIKVTAANIRKCQNSPSDFAVQGADVCCVVGSSFILVDIPKLRWASVPPFLKIIITHPIDPYKRCLANVLAGDVVQQHVCFIDTGVRLDVRVFQ